MITNPIIPGFNPDPCICRKGEDYYLVVSTFEWMPGLPVYHSRDLKHWELYSHVITDDEKVDLKKLPSAKGLWAPCLTYCEEEDLFYVVYGVMNSMNARYFDVDNFLITAKDIRGPWSEPVYLHSSGFDASLFQDDDGRKYVVALEWETREGYEKPGAICMVEYDPQKREIIGYPKRIWNGGTDRGCIEAPHLTKRNGYYYIMCAEGGTGYNHCVTMGRSEHVWGPYERDPENPILTSVPGESYERHNPDHLKPKYYNPASVLQKSGHGSYVETPESSLPECPLPRIPDFDDFDSGELGSWYYAPRIMPQRFADVKARPGWVRLRGQESRTSLNKVSILARKLTSVYARITTKMEFQPEVHQHSAGLILYYDNMNYINLRKYYSETLGGSALLFLMRKFYVTYSCGGGGSMLFCLQALFFSYSHAVSAVSKKNAGYSPAFLSEILMLIFHNQSKQRGSGWKEETPYMGLLRKQRRRACGAEDKRKSQRKAAMASGICRCPAYRAGRGTQPSGYKGRVSAD